ncbi:MAG: S-methyl-5'-thioadenosine phosphorylase [Candidatus Bathyarchaeota archaeon]|nr:S-methyl-5'-thioadenosine phosphorylase [Candidatus Bathyarchaeota archaeon]
MSEEDLEIGIIGGTGIYDPSMFKEERNVKIYTPFGEPSDLVSISLHGRRKIAFLPRHGKNHTIPPHNVNYRANIWALKEIGVKRIIAASAVGSLREEYKPGDFVIPHQFIDRTKKRADTFYQGGRVCHISVADPFCPELREVLIRAGKTIGVTVHREGTYVCIEGPRFSTRSESKLFRDWGADIIGMTLYPECVLARETELCYASVAMITDYDVWAEKPVSTGEVIKTMKKNIENFKKLVSHAIQKMPRQRNCMCVKALKGALI